MAGEVREPSARHRQSREPARPTLPAQGQQPLMSEEFLNRKSE